MDWLHCPTCQGRLTTLSGDALTCERCKSVIKIIDEIADFVADRKLPQGDAMAYRGDPSSDDSLSGTLLADIKIAAGTLWPAVLGDVLELGGGRGQTSRALAAGSMFRNLLIVDSDVDQLQVCRDRVAALAPDAERPVRYAALTHTRNALRDSVADTVIGTTMLSRFGDTQSFLAMVHRVLKPGGRAVFVVQNRRYWQAMRYAMAEVLVQCFNINEKSPHDLHVLLRILADTKRMLLYQGEDDFPPNIELKHLFEPAELEDMARRAGFSFATTIPLSPDPLGQETLRRICLNGGVSDDFTPDFAALAASIGAPFFNLLGPPDSSATMVLWLTKAIGPEVVSFSARHILSTPVLAGTQATSGRMPPRWSVELEAVDKTEGIELSVDGWYLCDLEVNCVRLTVQGSVKFAPVWQPRPDVHAAMNHDRRYQPLNALCCGIKSELRFNGVHAVEGQCSFSLDVVLANGLVLPVPAPNGLLMNTPIELVP